MYRARTRYYCRCGLHFSSKGYLNDHLEICTRLSPGDKHCRVSEEEWRKQRRFSVQLELNISDNETRF